MGRPPAIAFLVDHLRKSNWRWHLSFLLMLSALTAVLFYGYLNGPLPTGTDSEGLVMTSKMGLMTGGLFSSWEPYSALGFQNDPLPLPGVMFMVTSWLGLSTYDVCKLIMVCSFWLAGASMYLCALRISKSHLGGACAAVVFCFNQVFLSQIMEGHYFFVIGFALLPLVFLIFFEAMTKEDHRAILLLPVAFFIFGASAAPHMVLILAIFMIVFTGLYFGLNRKGLHRLLYPAVGLLILVLPSALSRFSVGTGIDNASYRLSEAQFWSNQGLFDALAAQSTENSHLRGAAIQGWFPIEGLGEVVAFVALLIPALAFLSLYFRYNRGLKVVLAGTALVMLFFAMGPNQLLSGLFVWMFRNIPLLDSIRVFSRFGMFLGLSYALLIAMLVADLRDRPTLSLCRPHLPKITVRRANKLVVIVAVAVMLTASSTLFVQGPSSFTLPPSYSEPFELISTLDGDYRILTLPYGTVYYDAQHPRLDGYPSTLTNDPGAYSQMITGKEVAYGDHAEEFWSVWGTAVSEHTYGYRLLPALLGDVASVKYVVSQVHALPEESEDYQNMEGLELFSTLPHSSTILVNSYYEDRVHAVDSLVLTTGGRAAILTSLASGVVDLRSEELVLWGQVDDQVTRQMLWNASDLVIIQGGDLMELMAENGAWDGGHLIKLADLADQTSDDSDMNWISSDKFIKDGSVLYPSAYTLGENVLKVPVLVEENGRYDIYLRSRVGPGSGNLTVTVGGSGPVHIDTGSLMTREAWTKVGTYDLNASSVEVQLASDGSGWCSADDLLLVEQGSVERKATEMTDIISASSKSISIVFGPADLAPSSGSWQIYDGSEGEGILDGTELGSSPLLVNTTIPRSGNWTITLRTMSGEENIMSSAPYLVVDGNLINGADLGNGVFTFQASMAQGEREIEVHTSSVYSMVIESSGEGSSAASSEVEVYYERKEPWQYVVSLNTTGPTFVKLSENFSPQWSVEGGDGKVLHYQSSSQINGFYITEGGNYTLTITFMWQERYQWNQLILMGTTVVATVALLAFIWWNGRYKRGKSTRQ
ncbi:MAG: hypothetical protein ISF22_09720 [Methanomassiliicoccus sp.]|nr:hypothetical protein [Methanomassiliicoccus sp.]